MQKADKAKKNVTDFLVSSALNKKIVVVDGLPDLALQVAKVGNNINQIARLANTNTYVSQEDVKSVQLEMKILNGVFLKFIKDLK